MEACRGHARQLRDFWANDSGTSLHIVAADNLDEAADQLTIYARRVAELEEALAGTVAARDEWLEADDGSNAEVHALARMSRADDKARAALTGEQG